MSTVQYTCWITKLILFLLSDHSVEIFAVDIKVDLAVTELESCLDGRNTGYAVPQVVIDQAFLSVEPGLHSPKNVHDLHGAVSLKLGLGLQFSSLVVLFELLCFGLTHLETCVEASQCSMVVSTEDIKQPKEEIVDDGPQIVFLLSAPLTAIPV